MNEIANVLSAMDGAEIPGGCELCDAIQVVRNDGGGVFTIEVQHDEWCPVLARRQR